jgi:hypothetical protein
MSSILEFEAYLREYLASNPTPPASGLSLARLEAVARRGMSQPLFRPGDPAFGVSEQADDDTVRMPAGGDRGGECDPVWLTVIRNALWKTIPRVPAPAALARNDRPGHVARKSLVRSMAEHVYGKAENLSDDELRRFAPYAACVVRQLFEEWAATPDRGPGDETITTGDDQRVRYPPMPHREEWLAFEEHLRSATVPGSVLALELRAYAGFARRDIARVTGMGLAEVELCIAASASAPGLAGG